jgi:hypothetical protein
MGKYLRYLFAGAALEGAHGAYEGDEADGGPGRG